MRDSGLNLGSLFLNENDGLILGILWLPVLGDELIFKVLTLLLVLKQVSFDYFDLPFLYFDRSLNQDHMMLLPENILWLGWKLQKLKEKETRKARNKLAVSSANSSKNCLL